MKKSILLMLLTLLTVTSALATVTQIGNGSESLYNVPLHAAQNYSWSHFILPGNAITNTGLITKLEFNVRNTLDGSFSSNQHVFMRLTNAITVTNAYTANPGSNGYTEVFDGSIEWNTNDWQGIELTTPFAYNGTSNLEIIWENRRGGWNPWSPVFTGTQSSQAAAYKSGEEFPETVGSLIGAYPNTRVTWQYSPIGLTCADPIPLNFPAINIMGNTANYGNNYSSNMITGGDIDARYLNGNDVVYQFTLAEPRVLKGTIITSASWMGAFILQQEPNATTPAPVILSKKSWDGNTITYNDDVLLSGTYYLIISSYPAPQSLDYTINLTATITTLQGSTCSNPIPLTFPATGITGNTADYGDDYDNAWVNPSSNYLSGDDVVYKFTFTDPMVLNGTITADGTYMGVFILKNEPNFTSPALVTHSVAASNTNSVQYSNTLIPAGTYYMIISTWTAPQSVNYTINLAASRPQGSTCANPIPLTFPAVNVLGSTEDSGNNYHPNDVSPAYADLDSNDIVYQFTLDSPMLLNGTITGTNSTGISALFLQDEPNASNPPPTILRACAGHSYSLTYTNELFSAGTYYLIICANTWVTHLNYSINLTATPVPGVASNPAPVNEATGVFISDNLTWQAASFADGYNVYLSTDQTFADISPVNQTGRNYIYSNLNYATTYYWKVIPYNAAGQPTGTIPVWSFTTCPNPFADAEVVLDGTRVIDTCLPMEADINYSMSQSIYYPEDLNFQGAITSISYLYNLNSAWSETIEVFMRHTSKDVFTNIDDWDVNSFTHVYSGSMAVNTTESVVTLNLDNPFYYHGTDNLMIMFFATEPGSMSGNDDFYSYQVEGNRSLIKYSNSVNYYPDFPTSLQSGDFRKYLPVTGFNYQTMSEEPNFTVSAETLTFADQMLFSKSEPQTLTISNLGFNNLGINSISITGGSSDLFQLIDENDYPATLEALGEMSVSVVYSPTRRGVHTSQLQITDNQSRVVHSVQLEGNAIDPQGATCSNPIPLTFPTGEISGTTKGYGNNYRPEHVLPHNGDLENNEEVVYQFTLAEDVFLNGTITGTTSTGISAFFTQEVPSYDNPAPTFISDCSGFENTLYYTNEILPAGTYYLFVFGNRFINDLEYTINLTTEPFLISAPITEFPWSEDFTNWPPAGYWHQFRGLLAENTPISTGTKWHHQPFINDGTVANSASLDINGGASHWLVSPSIDIDAHPEPLHLTFDLALTTNNAKDRAVLNLGDKIAIVVSTDDGATWSNTNILKEWVNGTVISPTGESCALSLAGYSGVVKFGFYAERASSPNPGANLALFLDNIGVSETVSLVTPAPNATNVSLDPTISFVASEEYTHYELYFGDEPNPTTQIVENTPLSNLVEHTLEPPLELFTDYYWKVVLYNADGNTLTLDFTFQTSPYSNGSGTETDPYQIADLNDLVTISEHKALWSKHFIQTANIDAALTSDLNDGAGFSPIGNNNVKFTGVYNGADYTISNLYINRPSQFYVGLFGFANHSNILNVGLVDVKVIGYIAIGGLVGQVYYSTISNSYVTGFVDGGSASNSGGLVGTVFSSTVSNSYTTCVVIGNYQVGGIAGFLDRSTINNCYATGDISGAGYHDDAMGGLVGTLSQSTLNNSYATGSVIGKCNIGGLVGSSTDASTMNNSYATGDVSGNTEVGGLVGFYERGSIITNSYATGFVSIRTARTGESIGGLVGAVDDSDDFFVPCKAVNSFWNIETTGQTTSVSGEGKTTAEMQDPNTYFTPEWDITEQEDILGEYIWKINAAKNNGYPYLVWAAANIEDDDNTLSVTLSSFMAVQTAENFAEITWITETESSLAGYNVFRNETNDEEIATKVNSTLIAAENTSVGSSYSYVDDKVVVNTTYYYWLQINEFSGSSTFHGPYQIRIDENYNDQAVVIPLKTTLRNIYPNPFNPTTTVSFYMEKAENVRINIYNVRGQLITNLTKDNFAKGFHNIVWNGKNAKGQNCASGMYFFRMETPSEMQIIKGILMK